MITDPGGLPSGASTPIRRPVMPTTYALRSTYPPTQCGLATFSAALLSHLRGPGDQVSVVRVLDVPAGSAPRTAPEVVCDLVNGSARSAATAVDVIGGFDVAIVQHEYGIYGGPDRGAPGAAACARRVYGADPAKVTVIPHGAADYRAAVPPRAAGPPPVVLTWGLLGPGKGIEHAIDAVALLRDRGLHVAYTVAGQTHPRVRARDGEAYRHSLQARATGHGVADRVRFDARFLPASALGGLIAAADVVLLPYDSLEQVTSGVLIEAVTAGKPVISTRFPHALEVLGGGTGLLVERQDPAGIASALHRVLTEAGLAARMSRHAAGLAPPLLWPAGARR